MPQRHFFGMNEQDKAQITEDIRAAVMKRANS